VIAAGGKAWWQQERGLVHGYLRGRHSVSGARASFGRIIEAVTVLGKGEWTW
jgi:acetyl esterase